MPGEIAGVGVFFGLLWSFVIVIATISQRHKRWVMKHKERMAAIDKGIPLPDLQDKPQAPWTPRLYMLRGMIWLFAGLALTVGSGVMYVALHSRTALPLAFSLIGLVPVGVGVAYLIYYSNEIENRPTMAPPLPPRK